jgi:2-polyprenyl-3-methyl-5-hydroxy-6-metoxy-1,4-benzoquinol methylase
MNYKHELILKKCEEQNVLDIGAANFPYHIERCKNNTLIHQKIKKVAKSLVGIDINKEAIQELKKYNIKDIYYGDIVENKYDFKIKDDFDIIIFGDVIEHLDNPGLALNNLKQFMSKKTILIITAPNTWSIFNIKNMFSKNENVHPDHTFWTSKKTMDNLIKRQGYIINSFEYVLDGSEQDKVPIKGKLFRYLFLKKIPHFRQVLYYETTMK